MIKAVAPQPFGYETKISYDSNNNRIRLERFAGFDEEDEPVWQTFSTAYSIDDRVESTIDPSGNVTLFDYNSLRLLSTIEDASSRVMTYVYDALGRQISLIDPANATQIVSAYTENGLLASLEDANGNLTVYEYDGFDRLKKKILPDETFEELVFDEFGQLTSLITRAGEEIAFSYDGLGRMIERTPENMPTVTYRHDLMSRLETVSTSLIVGDPTSGVFEYKYDSAGRLAMEVYPDLKQVGYERDEIGNVIKLTYPDGYYVEREYNELNQLVGVRLNGAIANALDFAHDELSRRTSLSYDNGVVTMYGIKIDNDVEGLSQTFSGSSVAFGYAFNAAHELTEQAVDDATFLWHPQIAGSTTYGAANELNQYPTVSSVAQSYNDNGCLVNDGVWDFSYDTVNQLVSAANGIVTCLYQYDPLGRQGQKSIGSGRTRYIHAGIRIIAEYDENDDLVKRFVHGVGIDEVLLEIDANDDLKYLHHDRMGSIIATTDDTGVVTSTYAYSPWGECSDMSGTTFGFQGQRHDNETGLYFMKARHYDPRVGRFLQPDPIGEIFSNVVF